jgi:hypothetical protein
MIVNSAYNTTEPNIGLRLNRESSALKCYMGDTGLLISLAFDEKGLVDEEVYKKILFNKFAFNEGMIMENIVAQMLTATGKNYTFSSLNKFRNKYKEYLSTGYVLYIDDLKVEDDIVFLPIYMTCLL